MSPSVFVMPRDPSSWGGASALWVTVAGWAGATRRLGNTPVIVTPSRLMSEDECIHATAQPLTTSTRPGVTKIPAPIRQFLRDCQRWSEMQRYQRNIIEHNELLEDVGFVWQHHELFHRSGERVARRANSPVIEYVHAPIVWEARRWGVKRPGWGRMLERTGDVPQLRRADLVACVSQEVAIEIVRLGAKEENVIVSPMGVDPERFNPEANFSEWRTKFNLGPFVMGWVGSFRKFHAIDLLLEVLLALRNGGADLGLVLVGDGQDRSRLEARVAELGLDDRVRFLGQVTNFEMPNVLRAFDAAVITAEKGQQFHYSPLKLREYMAMGLPVVAPHIGEMARNLRDGEEALLYEAGNARDLLERITRLIDDHELRTSLGRAGRELILRTGTWDVLVSDALRHLSR